MNNIKEKIKDFINFNKTSEENEFIDDLNYVKLCYEMLKQFGLIDTQYQFSEQLLNKSKFYYSMLISEGRKPSIHSMQRLVSNMKELLPLYKNTNKKETCLSSARDESQQQNLVVPASKKAKLSPAAEFNQLNSLINEGVDVITKRVLKLI